MQEAAAATPEGRIVAEGLVSRAEAAGFLGVGLTTLCALVAEGSLPSAKIGRRRLVPRAALHAFAAKRLESRNRQALFDLALRLRDQQRRRALEAR